MRNPDWVFPTLEIIIQALLTGPVDRLAYWRCPRPKIPEALFVVIYGATAIEDIAPLLIKITDKLPVHNQRLLIDSRMPITHWMDELSRVGVSWVSTRKLLNEKPMAVFVLSGKLPWEEILGSLAARHCPVVIQ